MNVISMDFGTSSLKLAVLDERLNIIETTKEEYSYKIPEPEFVEIEPNHILAALQKAVRNLSVDLNSIEGICYDTFSPSIVFMGYDGNPLYPVITHLDRRSRVESDLICKEIGIDEFTKTTGILPFIGGASITSILWIKNNYPNIYKNSYMIGHLNTYLHYLFTGLWGIDTVNASMTGMYHTLARTGWAHDLLHTIGLSENKLPQIYTPGIVLGELKNKELISLGLKEGIPVTMGTNDIASTQFGAQNNENGDILIVSGSSEMISILTDNPIVDRNYYLRASVNDDLWQIFGITSSGFALEWLRNQFFSESSIEEFYTQHIKDALVSGPGSVVYQPYISGDRHSLNQKKGTFGGIDLSTTRFNFLSAMIAGIHIPIRDILSLVEERNKLKDEIKVTGGLSNNPELISYKENLFRNYKIEVIENCTHKGNIDMFFKQQIGKTKI